MRSTKALPWTLATLGPALLASLATACSTAAPDEHPGSVTEPMALEQPGGVAQIASRLYMVDASKTLAGYATPKISSGCSGTMIGPNIVMTAAHCGNADASISFITFPRSSPTAPDYDYTAQVEESYSCFMLVNSFPLSDLTLSYCPTPAGQLAPGDKYGYLAFDTGDPVPPAAAVGDAVYSFWNNGVDKVTTGIVNGQTFVGNTMIYSQGQVDALNRAVWGSSSGINPLGVETNLWIKGGGSGSSQIRASNDRILIGPTSTGPSIRSYPLGSGGGPEGIGRNSIPMKTYFEQGTILARDAFPTPGQQSVAVGEIWALGLYADDYFGQRLDKNGNYIFDVQEDIERWVTGENARDWYFLGFESQRRNALWDATPTGAWFDRTSTDINYAWNVNVTPTGTKDLLVHRHLPIAPSTKYRLTVQIDTTSVSGSDSLAFSFRHGGVVDDRYVVPLQPGAGWRYVSFALTSGSVAPELAITASGTGDGPLVARLAALQVIKTGAVMDFDSADKRHTWRNDNNGLAAFILPDGEGGTSTSANWAGVVSPTVPPPAGGDWPLRNRGLALVPGTWYQLCFDAKQRPTPVFGPADASSARMRLLSAGTAAASVDFVPTATWASVCTTSFTPWSSDNNVQFGFAGPSVATGYYVDNLRINEVACVKTSCATLGASCGSVSDSCGGSVDCGGCAAGLTCGAQFANQCGSTRTCRSPRECCTQAGGTWTGKYCL